MLGHVRRRCDKAELWLSQAPAAAGRSALVEPSHGGLGRPPSPDPHVQASHRGEEGRGRGHPLDRVRHTPKWPASLPLVSHPLEQCHAGGPGWWGAGRRAQRNCCRRSAGGGWALQTARCAPRPGPAAPLRLLASQGFLFPSYNRVLANAFFCIP